MKHRVSEAGGPGGSSDRRRRYYTYHQRAILSIYGAYLVGFDSLTASLSLDNSQGDVAGVQSKSQFAKILAKFSGRSVSCVKLWGSKV